MGRVPPASHSPRPRVEVADLLLQVDAYQKRAEDRLEASRYRGIVVPSLEGQQRVSATRYIVCCRLTPHCATSKIVYPYPTTHYCTVPHESVMIEPPLCRPLPFEYFPSEAPPPVLTTPEVVSTPGSLQYIEAKLKPKGAWAQRTTSGWSSQSNVSPSPPKSASPATPPGLSVPKSGSTHTNACRSYRIVTFLKRFCAY